MFRGLGRFIVLVSLLAVFIGNSRMAFAQVGWEQEWERVQTAARKEGKLVINVPPDTALRRTLEPMFKRRYGIELELVLGRGAVISGRIADEYKAGVRYFDLFFTTVDNIMDRLLPMGAIESLRADLDSSRGQRSEKLVGRPYLERQSQALRLFRFGLHARQCLVQRRPGQGR